MGSNDIRKVCCESSDRNMESFVRFAYVFSEKTATMLICTVRLDNGVYFNFRVLTRLQQWFTGDEYTLAELL